MCKISFLLVRGCSWLYVVVTRQPATEVSQAQSPRPRLAGYRGAGPTSTPAVEGSPAPDHDVVQLHMTNREGAGSRSSTMGACQLKPTTATVIAFCRCEGHDWGQGPRLQCRSVCGRIHLSTRKTYPIVLAQMQAHTLALQLPSHSRLPYRRSSRPPASQCCLPGHG